MGLPSFFSPGSSEQLIITALITFLSFGIFMQVNPYHTHSVSCTPLSVLHCSHCWSAPLLTHGSLEARPLTLVWVALGMPTSPMVCCRMVCS